jgi:hypothetical protein
MRSSSKDAQIKGSGVQMNNEWINSLLQEQKRRQTELARI